MYLIRGLSGSGKSTLAGEIARASLAADDYFVDEATGAYNFDARQLGKAHTYCRNAARDRLAAGVDVAVANTFTTKKEIAPYLKIAKAAGATVTIVSLFDAGLTDPELAARNVHGVPVDAIAKMRARYEHDLKSGPIAAAAAPEKTDWIEAAEQKVSAGLVKLANQGSVPAATAVLKLLGEKRAASAASDHAARLVELATDGPGLARYLGALGQSAETAAIILARALTEAEAVAWNRGQLDRAIEARAIELHKARNAGKVENWMRKA